MNTSEKKSLMLDFGGGSDPFNAVSLQTTDLNKEEETDDNVADDTSSQQEDKNGDRSQEDTTVVDDSTADDQETDSDVDETDDASSTDPVEGEDEDDVNLYFHIGSELKKDSFLPDDFEIDGKIDGVTLKEKIKSKLREEIEPQIKAEYQQELTNQGYSEQDLIVARAIRQGVDPRLLSTASMYETFAGTADDSDLASKEQVIAQMYRTRGFNEAEVANLIKVAKVNEDDDDSKISPEFEKLFQDSKQFFGGKYGEFVKAQDEQNAELRKAAVVAEQQTEQLFNSILSTKKVLGINIDPDHVKSFDEGIRRKGIVEVNGQRYQATELQKFLYDFQSNDEMKLLSFYLHKFREQQKDSIKKEAMKEVESDFMKSYKQRVVKKNTVSKNERKLREQVDAQKQKGQPLFLDFSKQR